MESISPKTLGVPFTLSSPSDAPPPRDAAAPMAGASTNLGRSPANSSSSSQAQAQARPASSSASPSISRPTLPQPSLYSLPKQHLPPAHTHISSPIPPGDQDREAITLPTQQLQEALLLGDQDSLLRPRKEMADAKDVSKGDEVSYPWGGGQPGGTVTDVATDGAVTMETKNGNEVKKKGDEENPAVYIQRDEGHDVVKKASEIEIEEKKDGGASSTEKKEEESKPEENGEAKTGEKRAADEVEDDDDDAAEDESAKKQKTDDAEPQANGGPKKKGRPAKGAANGAPKKETKKREPKKAATESGEPRRSGRNASKSS